MATRWGGGRAQLWKSQGLAARRPQQTFPGLQDLQAGWESALPWAACSKSRAGLRDPRLHACCPVPQPHGQGTWGPRGSYWILMPNPDAGTWQVARVERACLLYGTHRSKEGEIVRFGLEGKVQSSDPCSPSPQSGSQGQRKRLLY